jgi:uncharacterized metal-binding protein
MRVSCRLRPVLFACAGCPEHGYLAPQVAALLDARNLAELTPLSAHGVEKARARFPVFALEGCPRACARQWLCSRGVRVQRCDMLSDFHATDAGQLAAEIAARW